jgi:ABC-type multidrug transport system fused ATPase/permease subunit
MIKKLKIMYRDVLYISKITDTRNKKIRILLTVVLSNFVAAVDIGLILIFSAVITNEFQTDNILSFIVDIFLKYRFLIPFLVIARFVFVYIQSINFKLLELEIGRKLKKRLLEEVFSKSNYSISDAYFYVNELTGHVTFFYQHLTGFINSIIQVTIYSYYLIDSDPTTLIYFLGGILVLYFPLQSIIVRSRKYTDKAYWVSLNVSEEIAKVVENMYLIKILKKDKEEIRNFESILKERDQYGIRTVIWGSLSGYLPTFLTMFVLAILVSFSNAVKTLTIDFIGVTLRLFQQLGGISGSVNNLLNSQIHIKHFNDIDRNRVIDNKENYEILESEKVDFSVNFENITFKYFNSETPIFENLTFKIPLNEHTLITGPNGSGKSTLLGLLSGVLIPENGKIFVSTKKLGYIGATPFIFKDTLRKNLLYGNELNIDDDLLINKLHEFDVFKEEENYNLDREVTNKSLSSGQMQKVAFIRALLAEPKILLLDESTANLDEKSKDLIFNILDKEKLTIINSTHDPNSFNAENRLMINLDEKNRFLTYEK